MKQTAVEWLIKQLDGERHLTEIEINRVIQQSKAMEKEQMRKAYLADAYNSQYGFEQYYNETFKSE